MGRLSQLRPSRRNGARSGSIGLGVKMLKQDVQAFACQDSKSSTQMNIETV